MKRLTPPRVWLPVLQRLYPELSRRTPTILCGSQVFYACAGVPFESKDIDLYAPSASPLQIMEAYQAAYEEDARIEFRGRLGGELRCNVYVPTGDPDYRIVLVEIFNRVHLGDPLKLFPNDVVWVERDGVEYWTLTLEAYAVLEATRPNAVREVGVERFATLYDRVDWDRAETLAASLDRAEQLRSLRRAAEERRRAGQG